MNKYYSRGGIQGSDSGQVSGSRSPCWAQEGLAGAPKGTHTLARETQLDQHHGQRSALVCMGAPVLWGFGGHKRPGPATIRQGPAFPLHWMSHQTR